MSDEQPTLHLDPPYAQVRIEWIGPEWGYHVIREIGHGREATEYDVVEYGPFDDGTYVIEETRAWLIANALRFPL